MSPRESAPSASCPVNLWSAKGSCVAASFILRHRSPSRSSPPRSRAAEAAPSAAAAIAEAERAEGVDHPSAAVAGHGDDAEAAEVEDNSKTYDEYRKALKRDGEGFEEIEAAEVDTSDAKYAGIKFVAKGEAAFENPAAELGGGSRKTRRTRRGAGVDRGDTIETVKVGFVTDAADLPRGRGEGSFRGRGRGDGPSRGRGRGGVAGDRRPRRDGEGDRYPRRDGEVGDRRPRREGEVGDRRPRREGEGDRRPRREDDGFATAGRPRREAGSSGRGRGDSRPRGRGRGGGEGFRGGRGRGSGGRGAPTGGRGAPTGARGGRAAAAAAPAPSAFPGLGALA